MEKFPKGGIIGKAADALDRIRQLQVPLYAANACYFLVLAAFPGLLLLLELLRNTALPVEHLGQLLPGLLPEVLAPGAEEWILLTYDNTAGTVVGISALTTVWAASRGIYGVMTGLNAIYGVSENRGWLWTRLISVVYTFAFALILLLTLGLHIFGTQVLELLERSAHLPVRLLASLVDFRFVFLLILQTLFFDAMFMVLPNRRNGFRESLPGAALASIGWLAFSGGYSRYVERFGHLSNAYGPVSTGAVSMLWLYCCISIVFCGGVWNVLLGKNRKNVSKP